MLKMEVSCKNSPSTNSSSSDDKYFAFGARLKFHIINGDAQTEVTR